MIASYLPYPLMDGGRIRLYNLLKNLSEKHEITLICERTTQTQKDIDEVAKICKKLIVIDRPKAWSARNVTKSMFSLNPLLTTVHTHKEITRKINEELAGGKFDLIHVETFYVMPNLPIVKIPVVLVEHNIEYMVYEKFAKKSSVFVRPALYYDILKLKRKEKYYWKKATRLVAVSPKEQKIMGSKAELVPNGVDLNKFKYVKKDRSRKEKKVLFIGNFKWVQNRDSAAFIIRNIWPKVINKNSNLKLWIVGRQIPDSLKSLKDRSITFDENAPNETELIFQEADILLSPIRVGGGSNFKILESMASGTPVITNSLGSDGIGAENNSEILIKEKPEEYASAILSLLEDSYLYEKISRNGRIFIENNFDWQKIGVKLDTIYNDVVLSK